MGSSKANSLRGIARVSAIGIAGLSLLAGCDIQGSRSIGWTTLGQSPDRTPQPQPISIPAFNICSRYHPDPQNPRVLNLVGLEDSGKRYFTPGDDMTLVTLWPYQGVGRTIIFGYDSGKSVGGINHNIRPGDLHIESINTMALKQNIKSSRCKVTWTLNGLPVESQDIYLRNQDP